MLRLSKKISPSSGEAGVLTKPSATTRFFPASDEKCVSAIFYPVVVVLVDVLVVVVVEVLVDVVLVLVVVLVEVVVDVLVVVN